MAKKNKAQTKGAPASKAPKATQPKAKAAPAVNAMPFGRKNYLFMIVAIVLLALGFSVMAAESADYGFGNLGLNVGPILLMLGFIVGVVSILIKPEDSSSDAADS